MKYAPKGAYSGKLKRCVYCGKSFRVEENILEHLPEKLRKERPEESED
ncbi:MAG: hypothetical protein NTV63_02500 [Candidatus Woesearchaeota archaeon]|nr:hypothetical protein [Candidatus Woesearchaeota archaeon]